MHFIKQLFSFTSQAITKFADCGNWRKMYQELNFEKISILSSSANPISYLGNQSWKMYQIYLNNNIINYFNNKENWLPRSEAQTITQPVQPTLITTAKGWSMWSWKWFENLPAWDFQCDDWLVSFMSDNSPPHLLPSFTCISLEPQ